MNINSKNSKSKSLNNKQCIKFWEDIIRKNRSVECGLLRYLRPNNEYDLLSEHFSIDDYVKTYHIR